MRRSGDGLLRRRRGPSPRRMNTGRRSRSGGRGRFRNDRSRARSGHRGRPGPRRVSGHGRIRRRSGPGWVRRRRRWRWRDELRRNDWSRRPRTHHARRYDARGVGRRRLGPGDHGLVHDVTGLDLERATSGATRTALPRQLHLVTLRATLDDLFTKHLASVALPGPCPVPRGQRAAARASCRSRWMATPSASSAASPSASVTVGCAWIA